MRWISEPAGAGTTRPWVRVNGRGWSASRTGRDRDRWPSRWSFNTRREPFGGSGADRTRPRSRPAQPDLDDPLSHPVPRAGAVVVNDARRVLLLWRHRFVTGGWSYEIPMGRINPGEQPRQAAAREVEEATGWRPGPLTPMLFVRPSNGLAAGEHHVFRASRATYAGAGPDRATAEHIDWVSVDRIRGLVARRRIVSATTVAALLMVVLDVDAS